MRLFEDELTQVLPRPFSVCLSLLLHKEQTIICIILITYKRHKKRMEKDNNEEKRLVKKNLNIVALILSRGSSKSIPGKNVQPFNGVPLIVHCLQIVTKCECTFLFILQFFQLLFTDTFNPQKNISYYNFL